MAAVFSPPQDHPVPKWDGGDFTRYQQLEDEWVATLSERARAMHPGNDYVGAVIRFPMADSCAEYLVWNTKPLQLVHLPIGDAWQIPEPHARGLRMADIKQMVDRTKRFQTALAREAQPADG